MWTASGLIGVVGVEWIRGSQAGKGSNPYYGIAPIARAARERLRRAISSVVDWPISGAHPAKTAARLVQEPTLTRMERTVPPHV